MLLFYLEERLQGGVQYACEGADTQSHSSMSSPLTEVLGVMHTSSVAQVPNSIVRVVTDSNSQTITCKSLPAATEHVPHLQLLVLYKIRPIERDSEQSNYKDL